MAEKLSFEQANKKKINKTTLKKKYSWFHDEASWLQRLLQHFQPQAIALATEKFPYHFISLV